MIQSSPRRFWIGCCITRRPSTFAARATGRKTAARPDWCRHEDKRGRRQRLVPWHRTPLRPKRAKRRRWAPLRPTPRRPIHELQGWGIFDRHNGEFSTGIDNGESIFQVTSGKRAEIAAAPGTKRDECHITPRSSVGHPNSCVFRGERHPKPVIK